MNNRRLLARLARGDLRNVAFDDACRLLIDLQYVDGQAKPYQLRQLIRLVERYDLELENER